jgi:Zn-dependent alcohol dehydrogenase
MKALVPNSAGRGFEFEDADIAWPLEREILVNAQESGLRHTDYSGVGREHGRYRV